MSHETQQKTFKFVKSPMGKINFRPPLGFSAAYLDRQHNCFLQCRKQTDFHGIIKSLIAHLPLGPLGPGYFCPLAGVEPAVWATCAGNVGTVL